jgi:hypothetical protein
MMRYIGCEYARARLEALVDGELSVDEQVAVESHVRWCRTCAARIEDLQLIGVSVRDGSPSLAGAIEVEPAISAVCSRVLMRVRAEHEQALGVRVRELFIDMRLLWPALGATLAVLLCVSAAAGVLRSASIERPQSLATRLQAMASPGSELNPLRPDNNARVDRYFEKYVDSDRAGGISMPRVLDDRVSFEGIGDEEAMFTMATVVSREGRIANAELLKSERTGGGAQRADHAGHEEALLDAVRQSRFAPAQTPVGRAVAVNMVWLIVVTTVQTPGPQPTDQVTQAATTPPRRIAPVTGGTHLPVGRQSARISASPTA